ITKRRDGSAANKLHHHERPTTVGEARIEHPGDVRVVHALEGAAFGFESRENVTTLGARLEQFECDVALHRRRLLGAPDDAHPSFADLFAENVRSNANAGPV